MATFSNLTDIPLAPNAPDTLEQGSYVSALIKFINKELNRGATYWEAVGGYTNTKTYIVYTVLSKYERMRLGRHMKDFDENAFMVGDDGVEIKGLFDKYLV